MTFQSCHKEKEPGSRIVQKYRSYLQHFPPKSVKGHDNNRLFPGNTTQDVLLADLFIYR